MHIYDQALAEARLVLHDQLLASPTSLESGEVVTSPISEGEDPFADLDIQDMVVKET